MGIVGLILCCLSARDSFPRFIVFFFGNCEGSFVDYGVNTPYFLKGFFLLTGVGLSNPPTFGSLSIDCFSFNSASFVYCNVEETLWVKPLLASPPSDYSSVC